MSGHSRWFRSLLSRFAALTLAAGLMIVVVVSNGCRQEPGSASERPTAPGSEHPSEPGEGERLAGAHARIQVGELVVADPEGRRLWRASAQVIEWDYDKQQATLRDVECVFVEDGQPALEARAPSVIAYIGERRVVLEDGVTARSRQTRTSLRADRLEWQAKEQEVYATGNVKYVRGDFVLTGPRLRADLSLKRARLEGGVQMQAVEPFETQ